MRFYEVRRAFYEFVKIPANSSGIKEFATVLAASFDLLISMHSYEFRRIHASSSAKSGEIFGSLGIEGRLQTKILSRYEKQLHCILILQV